jgi:hypothetical protein
VSAYEPPTPLTATPAPAASALSGSSQGSAHRSVSTPNSGCATDDSSEAARTMPEAAA